MRETKDHLCTLMITFSDWDNNTQNKEITTAHTFASTDPAHYPQQRRVVHSRQTMAAEVRNGGAAPLMSGGALIERVSQSALSVPSGINFGSDMVQFRQLPRSPPVPSVPLATSALAQQHQYSAGRLLNSPHGENPTEESNGRLSGQLKHSPTVGSAATSPLASSSTIGVHEVYLSYSRPNSFSPSTAEDRRSLPTYLSSSASPPFFPSGSVQMHFSAGKAEDARLLYTVGRPEADWAFGAGESIQISDSRTKKREAFPVTMGNRTMTTKSPEHTTTTQPRGKGQMEHTEGGGAQKQTPQQRMRREGRGSEQRGPLSSSTMFGPSPPPHCRPTGPVLSHHQTRSYESNEESKMSEERGRGKSRTVFEKTTCELLTEKSVTTYGRWQNGKTAAEPLKRKKEQKQAQQQQPTSRIAQQRRGLPRTNVEEMNGTYLYTRYGDGEEEDDGRRQTEVTGRERGRGENGGKWEESAAQLQKRNGGRSEWKVTEERSAVGEEMNRTVTRSWKKTPEGRWSTDERMATPLTVLLSERPFRQKAPEKMATAKQLQGTRLIDFETYKKEVEQLQQQALAVERTGKKEKLPMAMAPAVVIGPVHKNEIVLPKAKQPTLEATLKYFASDELLSNADQQKREKEIEEEKKRKEEEEERKRKRKKEEEEKEERRKIEEEEKKRRMEKEKLITLMEEKQRRRMEEEEEERKRRRRKEEEEEKRRRRMEEEEEERKRRRRKEEEEEERRRRRMEEEEEERKRRRRKEEERGRMDILKMEKRASVIRPQPIYVSTSAEFHQISEEINYQKRAIRSPSVEFTKEEIRELTISCPVENERSVSMEGKGKGKEKRAEEMAEKVEDKEEEKEKEEKREEREEKPTEYELDTSRGLGRHLLETLSRELQYQEEVDTEISRRRRRIGADGREETTEELMEEDKEMERREEEEKERKREEKDRKMKEEEERRMREEEKERKREEEERMREEEKERKKEEEERMREEEKERKRKEEERKMKEEEKERKREEEERKMKEEEKERKKEEEERMREEEKERKRRENGRRIPIEEEEENELLEIEETDVRFGRVSKKSVVAPLFMPIHRRDAKVSISGELSLPPVREEGEDEDQESTLEQIPVETNSTATSQTLPVGSRKRLPPPPPPKPPHSLFGTNPTTTTISAHPSEPHFRESSFSSVYSNFPQTFSTFHTYNTMEPPSVASSDYRSAISSRPYFSRPRPLSPTRFSSDAGGTRVLKMVSESSSISSRPMSPYPASTTASAIRDAREREKKEMSELNDRLANYIEKVRFLEAQNRKLATDLDFLHKRWGKDASNVREMYETDLRQAKKLLEETQRQKDDLEKKAKAMEGEVEALKKKNADALTSHEGDKKLMEELMQNLSSLEAELALLKRRLEILDKDIKAMRRENQHFGGELQKAKTDLDQETLNRIDYQNQVQTLLEEIDFLRRAHDAEIQDLQAMASRDTTGENREFFRNELASAIREIRSDYDVLDNRNRSDIESWYKMKVQEIQTMNVRQNMEQNYAKEEVKRLRTQLGDLRGKLADLEGRNSLLERQAEELAYQVEDDQRAYESALNDKDSQIRKLRDEAQALMVELQMLLDTKQTLDAEIAIYRKMLEGEEDRSGLYQLVEQVVKTQNIRRQDEAESQRILRGEKSSRQSYQRSAKGNVSILETSPEGKYIVLENTHRSKEEPIGEWKLKRRIDGKREIVYTFPQEFVLRPGKSVKVWARGQGINAPPDQLVFDGEETFGTGSNVQTLLYNRDGEERASLIQRSSGR